MYLFLIDIEKLDKNIQEIWAVTRFIEKLKNEGTVALWDTDKKFLQYPLPSFQDMESLTQQTIENGISTVVYILGNQCFLDKEIIIKGLERMKVSKADYFTQWEHSRLPIGIGIRAFSVYALKAMHVNSPEEALNYVLRRPRDISMLFDNQRYVSYEQSLNSSLFPINNLDGFFNKVESYDLQAFLSLNINKRYYCSDDKKNSFMVDERGYSSPYGFESVECAEFPTYLMFDITNVCNSKCVHCPHSVAFGNNVSDKSYLDIDIFKKAIDECKGRDMQLIRITADGEPLIHPELFEMIDYAFEKGVGPVGLTTNGSLLTKDKAERLAESGLFMVDVSLDAFNKETYDKVRNGLPFNKVIDNVKYLLDYKEKANSPLKVMVSFVKQNDNISELENFIDHWEPLVDKVLVREMISNVNLIDVSETEGNTGLQRWPCPHWFRRMVINYDGVIKACPIDWENGTTYEPLSATTIFDAWHSDFYWKNRMEHLNNQYSQNSLCKNCNDWQGTPWGLGYEKVVETL